jgi:hypothetical protein
MNRFLDLIPCPPCDLCFLVSPPRRWIFTPFSHLEIARFTPPAPLNRVPSGCSTGVKSLPRCDPLNDFELLFNWVSSRRWYWGFVEKERSLPAFFLVGLPPYHYKNSAKGLALRALMTAEFILSDQGLNV